VASGQHNEPVPAGTSGANDGHTDVAQRAGVSVGTRPKRSTDGANLRAERAR